MPKQTDLPFYNCSRYDKCNVNNCPLHPEYPSLYTDENDIETKCGMAKSIRRRIAAAFPGMLKFEGLTTREFEGRERWNSLTPEEQQQRRDHILKVRAIKNTPIELPAIALQ